MGPRKIVPLRPRQKEGSAGSPKKPLSLADVTITWGPPDHIKYVTGRTVAKLIAYASSKHRNAEGHDPRCGTLRLGPMLRGLGGWLFRDAGIPSDELESDMRFFVSEFLVDVAAEVESEGLDSENSAGIFEIHVGPVRKEWTQ